MLGAVGIVAGCSAQAAVADQCPDAGPETATIESVAPRGELRLADGRLLRLAGFDPAQATPDRPDLAETTRSALASKLVGKTVKIRLLSSKPDRWGRLAAFAWGADSGATADGGIAADALSAGLGRYLPEPLARPCRTALIGAEAKARSAKLGLWGDPYYGVLVADDRAGFAERTGTVVLAEGTVTAVQPGPFRTTVRFASPAEAIRGSHLLVATILPRVMKTFQAQQMDLTRLVGRRLRVRGMLDVRFGPRIELSGPDDIEVLEPAGTSAGGRPPN